MDDSREWSFGKSHYVFFVSLKKVFPSVIRVTEYLLCMQYARKSVENEY